MEIAARIESRIREALDPEHFTLRDDSENHRGHAGATSGGGHFHIVVVSRRFEGLGMLAQHRLVYEALEGMIGAEVHALGLRTAAPSAWQD